VRSSARASAFLAQLGAHAGGMDSFHASVGLECERAARTLHVNRVRQPGWTLGRGCVAAAGRVRRRTQEQQADEDDGEAHLICTSGTAVRVRLR
jgi:hypothetical protein